MNLKNLVVSYNYNYKELAKFLNVDYLALEWFVENNDFGNNKKFWYNKGIGYRITSEKDFYEMFILKRHTYLEIRLIESDLDEEYHLIKELITFSNMKAYVVKKGDLYAIFSDSKSWQTDWMKKEKLNEFLRKKRKNDNFVIQKN